MVIGSISIVVLLILNAFLESAGEMAAVLSGLGLALAHVLVGFYMIRWAIARPLKVFMTVVMGGIGIRLAVVGMAVVLWVRLVQSEVTLFLTAFGIYYLLFQIVELFFVHRGLQTKKLAKA